MILYCLIYAVFFVLGKFLYLSWKFFILSFKVRDIHIFLLEIFDRFYLYFHVIFGSFRRNWQIKTANYIVVETFDFRGLILFISHFLLSFRRW